MLWLPLRPPFHALENQTPKLLLGHIPPQTDCLGVSEEQSLTKDLRPRNQSARTLRNTNFANKT
jgi:hypothetical protein